MDSELTAEEKATNFETMRHIERVRNLLNQFAIALLRRGELHDQSKLERPEVELFTEWTPKLAACTYGSAEYDEYRKQLAPSLSHHYAKNRHHPEFFTKDEVWKDIPGYVGHYQVSSLGNVRSVDREVHRGGATGNICMSGKTLAQHRTPKGYCRVQLVLSGVAKNHMVHRLVADAFLKNLENKPVVNHINGIKHDNRLANLEWATHCENQIHAYDTLLRHPSVKYVVECEELGIVTFGCEKMETLLRERGYARASASGIWNSLDSGGKHLDLTFTATAFEDWMNSPVNGMNLLDIVEMLLDWKAASERHNDGNILKSIQHNTKRFNLSPQLVSILENTASLLDN